MLRPYPKPGAQASEPACPSDLMPPRGAKMPPAHHGWSSLGGGCLTGLLALSINILLLIDGVHPGQVLVCTIYLIAVYLDLREKTE